MKRAWDGHSSSYDSGSGSGTAQQSEQSNWGLSSHPYASAYSSLNPFQPSPLHNEASFDQYSNREPPVKKSRASDIHDALNGGDLGSEMGDDDDEDDEDDDGDDGNGKTAGSAKKGRGGKGGDKTKIKLTRGSRSVVYLSDASTLTLQSLHSVCERKRQLGRRY